MIEAKPVVGLAATPKSSYRSRLPVHVTPLSHTPPEWTTGDAVCRVQAVGRVSAGNTPYLVKWLDREIRFARKDLSVCANAGLTLPAGMVLPTAAELKNPADPSSDIYIGAKPTVNEPPRVIHGEVKF